MRAPKKPFASYKWRWAVLTPTEGLNDPPVFLGVLRALRSHEGLPPNSKEFMAALHTIQKETNSSVDLVRTKERNLIRNSGQYWKVVDLLGDTKGEIELTGFGKKVADGFITKVEFASTVIKKFELPNIHFETDRSDWIRAGLRIKPLELVLQILAVIKEKHGARESFITPNELIKIVIPLAGENSSVDRHVKAIILYRRGRLDLSLWPDCAPGANDKRMAREFLLFLWHYGFCSITPSRARYEDKYVLSDVDLSEVSQFATLRVTEKNPEKIVRKIRKSRLPSATERKRVMTEVLLRPNQPIFRNNVLVAYKSTCIMSGVSLDPVLEAAHIIPVSYRPIDTIANGLCLRSDIHLLYDSGHLRIDVSGGVHLSDDASDSKNYGSLPDRVVLPKFVNPEYIDWRWKYF